MHLCERSVALGLLLGVADVFLSDRLFAPAVRDFARFPEEIDRLSCVTVVLGGERRAQRNDFVFENTILIRVPSTFQDRSELVRVVVRKHDVLGIERAFRPTVEIVHEPWIVRECRHRDVSFDPSQL